MTKSVETLQYAQNLRARVTLIEHLIHLTPPTIAALPPVRTSHETGAHPEHDYDRQGIINDWREQVATTNQLAIIFDLDENLVNTVLYWIEKTNELLVTEYQIAAGELPTPAQVLAEGGPSTYYPNHFSEIWITTQDANDKRSFEYMAEDWRHDTEGNLTPPLLPELGVSDLMATFAKHGKVLGGLTARPATPRVIEATHRQMMAAGFYNQETSLPIIFKPKNVPLSGSGSEKLLVISQIMPEASSAAQVVLFDDSLSTARVIGDHNEEAAPHKKIAYILNAQGPLTSPRMDENHQEYEGLSAQLTPDRGIFVLRNWAEMDNILNQITAWHSQNSSS